MKISFKSTSRILIIVLFLILLVIQCYVLYMVKGLIESANDEYSAGILNGVSYEITKNIELLDSIAASLSENRDLQKYVIEKDEIQRKYEYSKVFSEVRGLTRFSQDIIYMMTYDLQGNANQIVGGFDDNMLKHINDCYSDFNDGKLKNDVAVYSDDESIVFLKFKKINMYDFSNVGIENVGSLCIVSKVNIIELRKSLNLVDSVDLSVEDISNGKAYKIFGAASKYQFLVSKNTSIKDTTWELECKLARDRIPSEYNSIWKATIIMLIILVIFSLMFLILLSRLFIKPINKVIGYLDSYPYKRKQERLENVGVTEANEILNHTNEMINVIEDNTRKIFKTQEELYEKEIEEKNVILYMYQLQIQPHFIYNTLGCIIGFAIDYNAPEIVTIADSMAEIFRYLTEKKVVVQLASEVEYVQKYLNIMKLRYPEAFTLHIDIDYEFFDMLIPKMILQPIVENALKHGILPTHRKCELRMNTYIENDKLCISIFDNGVGMPCETLQELREKLKDKSNLENREGRIGLDNVSKRIAYRCGDSYGVELDSVEGEFTKVKIILPVEIPNDKSE